MSAQIPTETTTENDAATGLINTTEHENNYIVATASLFGLTYTYVFKPRHCGGYTLGKFRVNDRTYDQMAAGDTDLPGERAAAERAFHAVQNDHDVEFAKDSIGHKLPRDLVTITTDEFTTPATDHTAGDLSMTLDGYRDKSNVTLTHGNFIYDYHTDTMHEVGFPHHRSEGACAREIEFRELPDGEFRTLNLSHVDTKLARGRWQIVPANADVTSFTEYDTEDITLSVGDIFTDLSEAASGLTDRTTMRITAIRTVVGAGTRVVLTPETSFDYVNDLNIRAVPIDDFLNANPTQK